MRNFFGAIFLFGCCLNSSAQQSLISVAPIYNTLLHLRSAKEFGLPEPFEVKGEVVYSASGGSVAAGPAMLATSELRLWPGSKLIISTPYSNIGNSSRGFVIYTPKIVVMPAPAGSGKLSPPLITWQGRTIELPPPPPVGKALSGRNGIGGGVPGAVGSPGTSGNPGFAGQDGPALYLATSEINGGQVIFDFRGQSGGPGGEGQAGGDGGAGGAGEPGSLGIQNDDCRRNPGNGGNGGNGGDAGPGGQGGRGGNGGSIYVISDITTGYDITTKITFIGLPGTRGIGGKPGSPGASGLAGAPAPDAKGCKEGASPGKEGKPGKPSIKGTEGEDGIPGEYGVFSLNPNQSGLLK